jgi:hypothetical protein
MDDILYQILSWIFWFALNSLLICLLWNAVVPKRVNHFFLSTILRRKVHFLHCVPDIGWYIKYRGIPGEMYVGPELPTWAKEAYRRDHPDRDGE